MVTLEFDAVLELILFRTSIIIVKILDFLKNYIDIAINIIDIIRRKLHRQKRYT